MLTLCCFSVCRTWRSVVGPLAWSLLLGIGLATGVAEAEEPGSWDVQSDTWVATDQLGRRLPTFEEVGPPRENKTVGIFYFLWLGRHGEQGPYDVSKILAADPTATQHPESTLWGPLGAPHHWGRPLFDYYVSDDDSVLRKHAQMLADAGIDMVVFDVTNQLTYPESYWALCRVWDESRRAGNRVPQIAFLCPFWDPARVVQRLWDDLYSKNKYPELWFRWKDKPLILADPARLRSEITYHRSDLPAVLTADASLGQTFTADSPFVAIGGSFPTWGTTDAVVTLSLYEKGFGGKQLATRRFAKVVDNGWLMLEFDKPLPAGAYYLEASAAKGKVGWWSTEQAMLERGEAFANGRAVAGDRSLRIVPADDGGRAIREFFTFRKPQPSYFEGPTGPEQWGWLEVTPQHVFYEKPGVPEQITVGVAQNAVDGKLGALSNPRSHGRSFHDGREPPPGEIDTTGRNFAEQWARAHKVDPPFVFVTSWNEWIAGRFDKTAPFQGAGPVTFVDQFNPEFSRDSEPMQGGHGDNYYYQLIAEVRRFKGASPIRPVSPQPIAIDGQFDDWRDVGPEFRDTIADPVHRDYRGWGKDSRYVNQTGRNDIIAAKVSYDDANVYFYVRTREPLSPGDGANWMLLLIDADRDAKTGWLGYDRIVNRQSPRAGHGTMERNRGGTYDWKAAEQLAMAIGPNAIELAIPRRSLGNPTIIDFKWADNIQQDGSWSDFTLNGDAAPNDRYNYRAVLTRKSARASATILQP